MEKSGKFDKTSLRLQIFKATKLFNDKLKEFSSNEEEFID